MTFLYSLRYNVSRCKSNEGVDAADDRRLSRDRLSYREKKSPAASFFKLQFVLNFRTGAALRSAQAKESRTYFDRSNWIVCDKECRRAR